MRDHEESTLLNPDIAAFLDLIDTGRASGTPPLHALLPAAARQRFEESSQVVSLRAAADVIVQDCRIPIRDGSTIAGRWYCPHSMSGRDRVPLLVYFHGGGYVVGSVDSHDDLCRALAAATPCRVLSVGYRLAPEFPFPAAVEDALDTLIWLRETAAEHHVDLHNIAVGGDSAGATLATVTAITAVHEPHRAGLSLKAQVLLYPAADISRRSESMQLYEEGYLLESATLEWFYAQYLRDENDRSDWRASPLLAADVSAIAPAIVALAQYDPLFDEGQRYVEKLKEAGVAVVSIDGAGMTHDFLRMTAVTKAADMLQKAVAAALAAAFSPD